MRRFPKSVLTIALFCCTCLAPSSVSLLEATPAQAKQLIEQPDGAREGDPEAWENPRRINQPLVSPQEPGPAVKPERKDSLLRILIQRLDSLLRGLRG